MIDKILRGWDAKGLVRYLMGKGNHNEHTMPTVIGAWQADPGALQPDRTGPGDFDFDPDSYNQLLEHINETAEAAGLPRRQPQQGEPGYTKHGYVWHCSLSLGPEDGELSFEQWSEVARDVMDRTGISPVDDPGGCRWIAVHHGKSKEGNDHIHIAAVLVRQDTGRRFHPKDDFSKTRKVMREWEDRLGLRATAINDGTAAPATTRGEQEKAKKRAELGYDGFARGEAGAPAKVQLRQVVTETAAVSNSAEEFLANLRDQGVLVRLRRDEAGQVSGYAVADPEDRDQRTGKPIFFGGRKLAPELSWPRLERGWTYAAPAPAAAEGAAAPARPHEVIEGAAQKVRAAAAAVRDQTEPGEHVASSLQPLLSAWARVAEGAQKRGELTRASWDYDRAARSPRNAPTTVAGEAARALRESSRELSALGIVSGRGKQRAAGLELALAVSTLLLELAAWFEQSRQLHHADAALASARSIAQFGESTNAVAPDARWKGVRVPDQGRARDRAAARGNTTRPPFTKPWTPPRTTPPQGPTLR
ncbi:relaxase/mobilization nuclease domain-containing protein [Rhodococcus hoagii]|nr:relaxase/mobilization nuclease domain-containing protein [Prescottella equi]NKS73023.1 relaxase/mobilization nuclease domain-containing protein [Prescottella equi]NKW53079.1 relaxase/mobilization nuclease domain-containing protein [Prescottella equi]NKZ93568.1 relaxase/mobilization nuclease domain-containing protein [Prescottella equi]